MSGGQSGHWDSKTKSIRGLEPYEHQVIVITLKGPIDKKICDKWNSFMKEIKGKKWFGDRMIAITMHGLPTPEDWRKKKL